MLQKIYDLFLSTSCEIRSACLGHALRQALHLLSTGYDLREAAELEARAIF